MLVSLGRPDLGVIAASYLGALLLGGLLLAIGIFLSGLTREQIVAFVPSMFVSARSSCSRDTRRSSRCSTA